MANDLKSLPGVDNRIYQSWCCTSTFLSEHIEHMCKSFPPCLFLPLRSTFSIVFFFILLLFEPSLWYNVIFQYYAFGFLLFHGTDWLHLRSHHETCLYNFDPLKPHFYTVKLGFTGVYIIFLISAQKHRLWVLVRTASPRRFLRVPTIYVLSRNMKNIRVFI